MTMYENALRELNEVDAGTYIRMNADIPSALNRPGTRLQTLVSCVNQNTTTLASGMHIASDAVMINQCNEDAESFYAYGPYMVRCVHMNKRGVGLSRNTALENCDSELLLFSDDDIVYHEGYAEQIEKTFDSFPLADLMLFNVRQSKGRETYHIETYGPVGFRNYGRYPAYAIAARTSKIKAAGLRFSLLFGGGAKYSNGEDSLFLRDCLMKRLLIFKAPIEIGYETERKSTWFQGFTDKFFFDRGVLYYYLYGKGANLLARRFLFKNRKTMCADKPMKECLELMKKGIVHASLSGSDGYDAPCGADD